MADNGGGRLGLMALIGFLLLQIGLTGRLGSILASFIDPSALVDHGAATGSGGGVSTGLGPTLPTSGVISAGAIALYALRANFPATSLQIATAIALAESGGNINAINKDSNGTADYGLWQINSVHSKYSVAKLLQPAYNASAALDISGAGSNWSPWTTYQNGAYLARMTEAQKGVDQALLQNVGFPAQ